jgi:(1->4)-alpha-D-glucan 1-alpha-D-glucosylmutase
MSPESSSSPLATYRVQLNAEFDFAQAAALADYLAELGITHLYVSPCLQAAAGSPHGYDVVDPQRVSDALGGTEGLLRLRDSLASRGMGLVVDIVPNHLAADADQNPLWRDVLANGRTSRWAEFFDIDWDRPEPDLRGKVLLPMLSAPLEAVLASGGIRLCFGSGRFVLLCEGMQLPLAPESQPRPMDGEDGPGAAARISQNKARLAELLEAQHYRLAGWREAGRRINYRRFFSITGLVGIRVEREEVFRHTHARVLAWAGDGIIDGLRVDHIDGLRDPAEYLRRLRSACPGAWVVVEKVLGPEEELPQSWPVDGTTGYDFLNEAGGLFVDPRGEAALTEFYGRFTGEPTDYAAIVRRRKHDVLAMSFAGELERLTDLLAEVSRHSPGPRAFPREQLREALAEFIASFPVYRTYLGPGGPASPQEVAQIEAALSAARRERADLEGPLWEFLRGAAMLRWPGEAAGEFVARLQQLTGPVAAKGVEDTALYCSNRLVSLNEVGGDPSRFGLPVAEFHRLCRERQRHWPRTMLATSTHNTKRSEDVRARISLLSEIPEEWAAAVRRWSEINEQRRRGGSPSRNDEYLFYQTLVGAWPIGEGRLAAYLEKAAREAKARTSWLDPDPAYEEALRQFVAGALGDGRFVADLEAFLAPLHAPGRINSLAQTLIKCTAPGVPDFYQGAELWDLSLVDPDNRRPVEYGLRRRLLAELPGIRPQDAWSRADEGLPKLLVIHRALALRRRRAELLGPSGEYRPLWAQGAKAEHVVAFVRGEGAVTVAPRLSIRAGGEWADTALRLPSGDWVNLFGGQRYRDQAPLAELLATFPVALLTKEGA